MATLSRAHMSVWGRRLVLNGSSRSRPVGISILHQRGMSDSSSPASSDRLPFSQSSLGLDLKFITPCLASIRQLPEVEAAWNDFHSIKSLEPLHRAVNIFQGFQNNGGEHVAVNALIAEAQHRQGLFDEAILTLDEVETQLKNSEALNIPFSSDDILLAKAKVRWTQGDFALSEQICESIIADYDDLQEKFDTSPLHLASAMTGKALSQLAKMDSMDEAFSVRDYFRVTIKFLERHPSSNSLPLAAAQANCGTAEAIYNGFVEKSNDVSVPMDAALKVWFQGLQKAKCDSPDIQLSKSSNFLQATIQAGLGWGILNYEHDRSDRLKKASGYAKDALEACGSDSSIEQDGLRRVLSIVASCYHQAGSAVTAEGLFQSATSRQASRRNPLESLALQDALLEYSKLCSQWDKRERDAERLKQESLKIEEDLPESWRGKTGLHSSLWFWTPADFQ